MKRTISLANRMLYENKGLTFIELIVVLSIVGTIAGVILFRYSDFSTNISLQNLAQDIALRIKEAQTNSISGRQSEGFLSTFNNGEPTSYGVYIQIDSTTMNTDHFIYFKDSNQSGQQDQLYSGSANCPNPGGNNQECLNITTISTADRIVKICNGTATLCDYRQLHITFARPFPDPVIKAKDIGPGGFDNLTDGVQIEIESAKSQHKTIVLWPIGQISVRNGEPTNLFAE